MVLSPFKKVRGTPLLITNASIMRLPDASQLGPLLYWSEAWMAMDGRRIQRLQEIEIAIRSVLMQEG